MQKTIRFLSLLTLWGQFSLSYGQQATPPEPWTGSAAAGIALTGGNSDTSNYSLSLDLQWDPETPHLVKFIGVYLRGDQNDETTVDRLRTALRDEYSISERTFLFGEFSYLRDPFKAITYLLNPAGGIGYKVIASERVVLGISSGAGAVWEKNPLVEVATSGTLNAGQDFSFRLSDVATITQVLSALWKTEDFEDYLYHFGVGLSTALTERTELKLDFVNDYKNVTPSPEIEKNDYAFITSLVFKF